VPSVSPPPPPPTQRHPTPPAPATTITTDNCQSATTPSSLHASSLPSYCLFNLTADPCEYEDLSAQLPDEKQELIDRLDVYRSASIVGTATVGCRAVKVWQEDIQLDAYMPCDWNCFDPDKTDGVDSCTVAKVIEGVPGKVPACADVVPPTLSALGDCPFFGTSGLYVLQDGYSCCLIHHPPPPGWCGLAWLARVCLCRWLVGWRSLATVPPAVSE
jgi:hypothetical protein